MLHWAPFDDAECRSPAILCRNVLVNSGQFLHDQTVFQNDSAGSDGSKLMPGTPSMAKLRFPASVLCQSSVDVPHS